jgi:hypothetical protein
VKWSADVEGIANGNPGCDVTGGLDFGGLFAPCDFAALEALYPPDQYPGLYTLYDFAASGHGNGAVTVQVTRFGEVLMDYSLTSVPEPSSLLLLLTTAVGIAWLVHRSRRRVGRAAL